MIFTRKIEKCDQNMLEVIKYEQDMLVFSAAKLPGKIGAEKNLFLESFLLHARNLIGFLEVSEKATKDDILITDFKNTVGEPMVPISLNLDRDIKKKINKHCQHLSRNRLKEKWSWDVVGIKDEILRCMNRFYNDL